MSMQDMSRRAPAGSRLHQVAIAVGLCALAVASAAGSAEPDPAPPEEPPTPVAEPEETPAGADDSAPEIDAELRRPADDLGRSIRRGECDGVEPRRGRDLETGGPARQGEA